MRDDRSTIRALLAAFDALKEADNSLSDKHLAIALGVNPSQVGRWRRWPDDERSANQKTRDAIASLGEAGLAAFEAAARHARATMQDMERALDVRRRLTAAAIGSAGGALWMGRRSTAAEPPDSKGTGTDR